MERTYTKVGSDYSKKEINAAITKVKWEAFRTDDLPFCQGEALKTVIKECNVPLSKITRMSLYGTIKFSHGFYSLDVKYKNGQAQLYIADNGCSCCVVASDFEALQTIKG
jgi:hypothetical protein